MTRFLATSPHPEAIKGSPTGNRISTQNATSSTGFSSVPGAGGKEHRLLYFTTVSSAGNSSWLPEVAPPALLPGPLSVSSSPLMTQMLIFFMVPFSSLLSTHPVKMRHMTISGLIFYQISVPVTMAAILDSRVIWTAVQWARLPAFSRMPPIKISTLSPNLLSFSFACLHHPSQRPEHLPRLHSLLHPYS